MKIVLRFIFLFCFLSGTYFSYADNRFVDSLRQLIETSDIDTVKVNCWNTISRHNSNRGYYVVSEKSALEALSLATKVKFTRGMADAHYYLGISFSKRAKYDKAVENYQKAISLYEQSSNLNGVAWSVMLIAVVDYYTANNIKAEAGYKNALAIFEKNKNNLGMANCLVNLAVLYQESKDYDNSIKTSKKAFDLFSKSPHGRAVATSNIAGCYSALYLENLEKGKKDIAESYLKSAKEAFNNNIIIYSELDMPAEKAGQYMNLFNLFMKAKNYESAKPYLDSAHKITKELNNVQASKGLNAGFYNWYLSRGDSSKALFYFLKYSADKDSVFNTDQSERMETMNIELAELEKQKEIDLLTKDKEKRGIILWGLGLFALLAVAISVLFFIRYRDKKSANLELTKQKKIIEEKNKEITDSIHYAKRIQTTLLPSEKYILKNLNKQKD